MLKKIASLFMILLIFLLVSCKKSNTSSDSKQTNKYIAIEELSKNINDNSIPLFINEINDVGTYMGFGAEVDPYFLGYVGTYKQTGIGERYLVKEEDWENYIVPSMRDMKIQRIRMMIIDSYYCNSLEMFNNKNYSWNSKKMQDVCLILDTAMELGIDVNVTFFGFESDWIKDEARDSWVGPHKLGDEYTEIAMELIADVFDYLLNEKGYTCIKDITYMNEPTSQFELTYGYSRAFDLYEKDVLKLDEVFKRRGLRDKVLFNMSDDTTNYVWLEKSAIAFEGIADVLNSHNYQMTDDLTNYAYCHSGTYKLETMKGISNNYNFPLLMNEFGVYNDLYILDNDYESFNSGKRAITISRQMVNILNNGVVGGCFWTYYTIHNTDPYVFITFNKNSDESYIATQLYYAFSLFTRFTELGSEIYPINSADDNICAVALKTKDDKWTYIVVNNSEDDKLISLVNCYDDIKSVDVYSFLENGNYSKKNQIQKSDTLFGERIIEYVVPNGSVVVFTQIVED